MALAKSWPLNKVTDGDRWGAENLLGRLGIVAHAVFLYAGFLPHGAPDATPWSLSARYSLPQLVHRDGRDTVVMRLSSRGRRGVSRSYVALKTYVSCNKTRFREHRMRLDNAALALALSGDVDGTARDLRTQVSVPCLLWQLLADELCQGLFLLVCHMNGVPVAGFVSLPGDIEAIILARLHSARDLACVECTSKELRLLAAEHDADLWKPKYEGTRRCPLCRLSCRLSEVVVKKKVSWKQRYVKTRLCRLELCSSKKINGCGNSTPAAVPVPRSRRRKTPAVTPAPVADRALS